MRIIGLDPGLRHTGYGIIESSHNSSKFIASGTISAPSDDSMDKRLLFIFNGLQAIFQQYSCDLVAIEEIFVSQNFETTLKLGQARAMCLIVPALHNIQMVEYATRTVKQTVTGSGKADKGQIQTMLKILMPTAQYKNDHEADALACAITGGVIGFK